MSIQNLFQECLGDWALVIVGHLRDGPRKTAPVMLSEERDRAAIEFESKHRCAQMCCAGWGFLASLGMTIS